MLRPELGGFGISKYADNDDYYTPVLLEPGRHTFHGVDTYGDGWQGGWFEILDQDGVRIAGGETDGVVESDTNDVTFSASRTNSATVTVHIRTGDWANEVQWSIDDGIVTNDDGETTGYGGPVSTSDIQIGGTGYGGFAGQLGAVSIVGHTIEANEAKCLYESGAAFVGTCPNFESRWSNSWLVLDDDVPEDASLRGDAFVNGKWGLTLDGSGDYMTVPGESLPAYAASGEFGVSMWFTRVECRAQGRFATLFSHKLQDDGTPWWDRAMDSSSVEISVGCADAGTHSTIEGDLVRTIIVDDATPRQRMAFDWSLSSVADNGPANRQWVHMVLSVRHEQTQVFVDGLPVSTYGFGLDDPEDTNPDTMTQNAWMTDAAENLAYQSTATIPGPIRLQQNVWGGFGLSGYGDRDDYFVEAELDAGDHIIHAVDTFGDGWQGGWFEVSLCTGRSAAAPCQTKQLLVGGEADGVVQGEGSHLSFRLASDATVELHIRTGIWASEVAWSFDDGSEYSGPEVSHVVSVGGQAPGWSTFMGEIAAAAVHRNAPDQQFVTCLRDFGLDHVQQCADPSRSGWRTNWVIMNGTISSDAVLMGDANVDDDPFFGVNFDGEGDSLKIGGNDAASYALDGTFGISFWFTRRECDIPGRYEELFRQQEKNGYGGSYSGSAILIEIGCASGGVHSTIPGDIVRTYLRDADGKRVSFDWSISNEASNGYGKVLSRFVALSVSLTRSALPLQSTTSGCTWC